MNESTPGFKYHDRLFIVSGKGSRLNDTLWLSNSPGSGYTVPIIDWKKSFSDHPEVGYETHFIHQFEKWRQTNKPLKSKKQNYGIIEVYEIPVYPASSSISPVAGWSTSMARYDIYGVNTGTDRSFHIAQNDIVKPISKVYLVYSQQKYVFIHLFQTKKEAMGWYDSTGVTESNNANFKYVQSFEGFLNESKKETGLMVYGRTNLDNNAIGDWLEDSDYTAEWNHREGYWLFPEEEENYDELEIELEEEFRKAGIRARFEGIFK